MNLSGILTRFSSFNVNFFLLFLISTIILRDSTALKLPSYIKACSRSDPKLNECALKNGRDAIPKLLKGDAKYRIPNLMPLEVEEIEIGDGPHKNIGLKLSCKKCKIYGLDKTNLEAIKLDLKKRHIHLELSNPKVDIKGKYTASGKVLVLPITGDGDADIALSNVKLTYNADYDLEKINGKDHIKLKNPKLSIQTTNMKFKLTNLFNGDKLLGDNMNTFLNENWQELLKEFGPAVSDTLSLVFTTIINGITKVVPAEEVFVA